MNPSRVSIRTLAAEPSLWTAGVRLVGLFVVAVLVLLPVTAGAQTGPATPAAGPEAQPQAEYQCFYPVADSYVDSTDRNANFGGASTLVVQHTDVGETIKFVFLQFDLSAIPSDSAILGAELKMYLTESSTQAAYQLGRATGPWQEYNLTWNNQPGHGGSLTTRPTTRPQAGRAGTLPSRWPIG